MKLDSLPWAEILELMKSSPFSEKIESIPTETLEFAVKADNYRSLVESAMEALKKSDPEKANLEYAAKMADLMKEFASKVLKSRNS